MSEGYDNTDKGALFKNDKQGNDKRPDYRGQINVGGNEFWLSAWLETSKKGEKYMSLRVKAKDEAQPAAAAKPAKQEELNDDIPF